MPASAAPGTLQTSGATGNGVTASGSGILDLRLGGSVGPAVDISGASARLHLVDEAYEDSVRFPLAPEEVGGLYGNFKRYPSDIDLLDFTLSLAAVTDDDARVIALGGSATTDVNGRFESEARDDQVIEASHATANDTASVTWQYYEYRTGETLDLSWNSDAEALVEGDFDVYFWGTTLSYSDAAHSGTARTGHTVEPSGDGNVQYVQDEHFRYAILSVTDGVLHFAQSSGEAHFFCDDLTAAPDDAVTFRDAQGTLPTVDGRLDSAGGVVQAAGGSYRWALEGEGMAVSVLRRPTMATGTDAVFAPGSEPMLLAPWFIYSAVAVLMALIAAGSLYPSHRGKRVASAAATWRERRADGYASMAASAETAGHPRLAAFFMAWALRIVPADPLRMVDLAILRAQAGDVKKALRLHEAAHSWLLDAGNGEQAAHNAYEAAKAAARLGRKAAALDWLRMALESEPGIVTRIGREPAFANLRGEADYASISMGAR